MNPKKLFEPIMSIEHFFREKWEKECFQIPEHNKIPFTADDFIYLLNSSNIDRKNLKVFNKSKRSFVKKHQVSELNTLSFYSVEEVVDHIVKNKSSIVLSQLQKYNDALDSFCRSIDSEFAPLSSNINLYLSPSNSIGVQKHFDQHDILVYQVYGSKVWPVWDSPKKLADAYYNSSIEIENEEEPSFNITMREGDLMYLPRGMSHAPYTEDSYSIHLAIGLFPATFRSNVDSICKNILSRHNYEFVKTKVLEQGGLSDMIEKELASSNKGQLVERSNSKFSFI